MVPQARLGKGVLERVQVKLQLLVHAGSAVIPVEDFVFEIGAQDIPDPVHAGVVPADEVSRSHHQTGAHAFVVAVHVGVEILGGEVPRPDDELGRPHEIRDASHQVRILPSYPESHEAAHRETGNPPVGTVRNGAVIAVDVLYELGKVNRELSVSLDRSDIVRTHVVFARSARVVAVPLHHDHGVLLDEGREVVAAVIVSGIIGAGSLVWPPVVALAPAVKEVDDRIPLLRRRVIVGRQEDPVVAGFSEDPAVMFPVQDLDSRTQNRVRSNPNTDRNGS